VKTGKAAIGALKGAKERSDPGRVRRRRHAARLPLASGTAYPKRVINEQRPSRARQLGLSGPTAEWTILLLVLGATPQSRLPFASA